MVHRPPPSWARITAVFPSPVCEQVKSCSACVYSTEHSTWTRPFICWITTFTSGKRGCLPMVHHPPPSWARITVVFPSPVCGQVKSCSACVYSTEHSTWTRPFLSCWIMTFTSGDRVCLPMVLSPPPSWARITAVFPSPVCGQVK